MTAKGIMIHLHLTVSELAAIEAFVLDQAPTPISPKMLRHQPTESILDNVILSDAIRRLTALGLRATQPPLKIDLKDILQEIDPAWSGRTPRCGKPLQLGVPDVEALEEFIRGERSR